MKPAAVYDIETQDWVTFVLGAVHYADGRTVVRDWRDERAFADELLEIDGEVWAHNGGRFDHLWLLDQHPDREATVTSNSSGIVSLRFEGSPALFLDSMRVFPFSLATLTGGAKGDLSDLCPGHDPGTPYGGSRGGNCGGYCRIRRDMNRAVRRRVEEYLTGDVVELMRALDHFGALAEEWGVDVRRTLGGTSWASAEAALGLESVGWTRALWAEVRDAYQGGRAEPFRRWSAAGWAFDVNSMYPWALTLPVPVGPPREHEGASAARAWRSSRPGVFRATVRVPETWIPPLPVRTEEGIAFPWGRLVGHWTRPELERAIADGARVERVHSAVTWGEERAIFGPWVEKMYALRKGYGKDTREGKWLKWIVNALTGRLGTRSESRRVKVNPDLSKLPTCRCDDLRRPCACGGYRPLDELGRVWEQVVRNRVPEDFAHPEWAAYLTARARVKLLDQLVAVEGDAVYCDTDSCWSERPRGGVGAELGEWEPRGRYRDFEALGPKAYRAELAGQEVLALKGVPNPSWKEVREGVPQRFESMAGLRRPQEGRFFARVAQARTVTPNSGTRLIRDEGDPRTYPPHWTDVR